MTTSSGGRHCFARRSRFFSGAGGTQWVRYATSIIAASARLQYGAAACARHTCVSLYDQSCCLQDQNNIMASATRAGWSGSSPRGIRSVPAASAHSAVDPAKPQQHVEQAPTPCSASASQPGQVTIDGWDAVVSARGECPKLLHKGEASTPTIPSLPPPQGCCQGQCKQPGHHLPEPHRLASAPASRPARRQRCV